MSTAVRPLRPVVASEGTDAGRERENNEDRTLCDPDRGIYAVIDGVGGESGGEVAAQTAVEILRARLSRRTTDLDRLVREAIAQANRQIYERAQSDPKLTGMACVLTVAIVEGDRATVGHVGDSRLYRLRRGEIRKITRDHSPVGTREDSGELSEDEAMHHPRRNEIFRDVGSAPHEPDEDGFIDTQEIPFGPEDALLFCSDGLSDLVPSARIRETVEANAGKPRAAIEVLIAAANEAGGKDNISIVLVEGERYAETVIRDRPAAASPAASKTGVAKAGKTGAPKQYGSAHVRIPLWRRTMPWVLLMALIAAGAALYLFPDLRERLLALWPGLPGQETPLPEPAPAAALRVGPGERDFATIHEALAEARPGQTVEVAPGEYRETLELPEGVVLVSLVPRGAVLMPPVPPVPAPAAAPTPGTAAEAAAVLTARGVSGKISGFRIAGAADAPLAVGLRLDGSRVLVSEMEISGASQAGIEITGPDRSTIETSFLHDNGGPGLVIGTDGGAAATQVRQNLISKNGKGTKGPGVDIRGDARPLMIDNRIEGNSAAGIWLPKADRVEELFGWNRFEGTPQAKAVRVAPKTQTGPGR